jgi:ATP synthase protein I
MDTIKKLPEEVAQVAAGGKGYSHEDEADELEFKPMSRQEAEAWRKSQVSMPVWRVVSWQFLVLVLMGSVARWITGSASIGWSVAYGGFAVAFPSALMAWGMTTGRLTRLLSVFAQGSLAALLFWEGVKVLLTVALLAMAPVVVSELNWLALVVGLVFVLKVYWVAFLMLSRTAK